MITYSAISYNNNNALFNISNNIYFWHFYLFFFYIEFTSGVGVESFVMDIAC